ncbi:MAG TPA: hypothetical protein VET88_09810 [Gammaproteobacteria bacterium]|nr:hypothetical protein [Gammaproteobacteria bacterium]
MKKLTDDLKRMLDGLASQDAGEYLSMDAKLRHVGREMQSDGPDSGYAASPPSRAAARRIAVVINKGSTEAAYNHALQASQRLDAHLDLLLCGPVSRERVVQLEAATQRAGVAFSSVYLSGPVARGIADYTERNLSLIYVVAPVDDPDMAEMVEETLPARRRYLPVPLVLVGNKTSQPVAAASAM